MRRLSLSVCILLLVILIISGCGQAASSQGGDVTSEPHTDSDNTLISITSNGETILPYQYFSSCTSWTGEYWVSGDALGLASEFPDIAGELPVVSYHDDLAMQNKEGVYYSYMQVFDDNFERLYHITTHSDKDYLTCLAGLPEGTYYVGIAVSKQGDYIASEGKYEYSGYDCVFKLVVEQ